MAISVKDFWKLAIASQLVSLEECKRLHAAFALLPDAEPTNITALAQWLVTSGVLSRYQAMALLAGRSDRFIYGNYKVFDRHETGRLKGLYRAVHGPTSRTVLLYFFPRSLLQDPQCWALAAGQAQLAIGQQCQRVSRVLELIDLGSLKCLAIEDLQGMSLTDSIASCPLAPNDACRIVRDLTLAIAELHALGQAHADVRPENVWITHEGNVRLLGFPLARSPAESPVFRANDPQPSLRLQAQADYLRPSWQKPNTLTVWRTFMPQAACCMNCSVVGLRLLVAHPPKKWHDTFQNPLYHLLNLAFRCLWPSWLSK